jgi:16S rRNA (guanine966-N2)-methyltransferase
VTFCDKTRAVALHLKTQTERLSISDLCDIHCMDAERFLKTPTSEPYNIVFCDPPFRQDWATKLLALLPVHMAPQGLLYLETESETLLDIPAHWTVLKEKTAGQVTYRLLMRIEL